MISEALVSEWSNKRSQGWLLVGLGLVGGTSYFDGGWSAAIRAPLSIVTVIVVGATAADLFLWLFRRERVGKAWFALSVAALVLIAALSMIGDALWLVVLAISLSGVAMIVGLLKSVLSNKWG